MENSAILQRSRASVAPGFVAGMLAGPRRAGHDPAPWLAAAGIDLTDPAARIPLERYAALYNLIIRELDDEGFCLFSQPLRGGAFEFLCRALAGAPTLAEALARAGRFLRIVLPDLAVSVKRGPESAGLAIAETRPLAATADDPARVFAFEWLLRLLHGLSCWLVGRGLALDAVAFPYPRPPHADDYALIYTEHSEFALANAPPSGRRPPSGPGQCPQTQYPCGFTEGATGAAGAVWPLHTEAEEGCGMLVARFQANLLDLPIRRDEAALTAFLDGAPGKLTMLYRRDRAMVLRVRDLLRAALPAAPDLETVAARLHLSSRTLHRRLAEEGSSFRAIKDALRRDLALARLAKTDTPITQIAADLGYADPSAFYRAFVEWTGMAPAHYRRQLAAGRP